MKKTLFVAAYLVAWTASLFWAVISMRVNSALAGSYRIGMPGAYATIDDWASWVLLLLAVYILPVVLIAFLPRLVKQTGAESRPRNKERILKIDNLHPETAGKSIPKVLSTIDYIIFHCERSA